MFSLSKNNFLKFFGQFLLVLTGLMVLFGSLVITGLKVLANDKNHNSLRNFPIEYVELLDNGEKIVRIYKVPQSMVGPKDIKYPIKKLRDKLWIDLSQNPKDKAEVCLLIADKRMFEAVDLISKGEKEKIILKTLNESIKMLKEAEKTLLKENKEDIEISKIKTQIQWAGLAYEDIVKSLNYKNIKTAEIIKDLESWNQKVEEN